MNPLLKEIHHNPLLWLLVFVPLVLTAAKLSPAAHTLLFVLSAQGEPAPKARAKAVVDGNQVNIPGPARSDTHDMLSGLNGLSRLLECVRKQLWRIDRTRNRHRWTGRAYQGA